MQLPRSQYIPYATNTPFQENIKWGVYRFAVFSKSGQRGNKAVLLQHDGEICWELMEEKYFFSCFSFRWFAPDNLRFLVLKR